MSKLQQYIDQRVNFWRVNVEKKTPIRVSAMTLQDAERIRDHLCGDASPENVSCDGECSITEVRRKMALYRAAAQELMKRFPHMLTPQYDDGDLFSQPVARPTVDKTAFIVGSTVHVNHRQLGGRLAGTLKKVNRLRCVIDFGARGVLTVPMELIEV
jgi:hypothetical protein